MSKLPHPPIPPEKRAAIVELLAQAVARELLEELQPQAGQQPATTVAASRLRRA